MDKLKYPVDKKVYLIEVDDVLYPSSDYDLQVYYLFANFLEFTAGYPAAKEVVDFVKSIYANQNKEYIFGRLQEAFGLEDKYKENLLRLSVNAQLPLKLLLFKEMEQLLVRLFTASKQVAILTKGNPVEQLNKIKHIDWGEATPFKNQLKVYFNDELKFRSLEPISYIAEDYGVSLTDIHFFDKKLT